MKHRVVVVGAGGRMGRAVLQAVRQAGDMELVGAVGRRSSGRDVGELLGEAPCGLRVGASLTEELRRARPDVVVDFTTPEAVLDHLYTAVRLGVRAVVGTTGFSQEDLRDLDAALRERGLGAVIAPNFAIGAVLMMRFAAEAARHFPHAEIIELHHEGKRDAPSGTALLTAERLRRARGGPASPREDTELVAGARGGEVGGVRIHSIRLPGLVAHQEVIFGMPGELLHIRHDALDRISFMPGVLLAIRRVHAVEGILYGLEELLFPSPGPATP